MRLYVSYWYDVQDINEAAAKGYGSFKFDIGEELSITENILGQMEVAARQDALTHPRLRRDHEIKGLTVTILWWTQIVKERRN